MSSYLGNSIVLSKCEGFYFYPVSSWENFCLPCLCLNIFVWLLVTTRWQNWSTSDIMHWGLLVENKSPGFITFYNSLCTFLHNFQEIQYRSSFAFWVNPGVHSALKVQGFIYQTSPECPEHGGRDFRLRERSRLHANVNLCSLHKFTRTQTLKRRNRKGAICAWLGVVLFVPSHFYSPLYTNRLIFFFPPAFPAALSRIENILSLRITQNIFMEQRVKKKRERRSINDLKHRERKRDRETGIWHCQRTCTKSWINAGATFLSLAEVLHHIQLLIYL